MFISQIHLFGYLAVVGALAIWEMINLLRPHRRIKVFLKS
jgi:hypothetical protein